MGNHQRSLLIAILLSQGCAQELPGLPEASEDALGAVEWVALRGLQTGGGLDPSAMPAGATFTLSRSNIGNSPMDLLIGQGPKKCQP